MKRILPLAFFEVFVWALLLLVLLLVSRVAFGITVGGSSLLDRVVTQVVRAAVSASIVIVWLVTWKKTTDLYFWRTITRRQATSRRSAG